MNRIFKFLTSLKLTVVCLAFGIVLVFIGTLAQVNEGLYMAQSRWFRSFFIWWGPQGGAGWQIPIFPGGYLIGIVLLANLIAAHLKRFKLSWNKLGINVTHAGIILLLLGQLITDIFSRETQIHFAEGEKTNYSESYMQNELVFMTDSAKPEEDQVISIPESFLKDQKEIRYEKLPFNIAVKQYFANSDMRRRAPIIDTNPPPVTEGMGTKLMVEPLPVSKETDKRNLPSAVLELAGSKGALGSWLVSPMLEPQEFEVDGKKWRVALRGERSYFPYSVQLLKTTHEVYPGTDIPKNFQSRVRIENPVSGENREVDIYMNSPLRYAGQTFFQYQMGREEANRNRGTSALQVVKNPGWVTPYLGCVMVGGGMAIQFLMHLVGFISKRRKA